MTSKEQYYKYGESLGIKINDLQRLKMLADNCQKDMANKIKEAYEQGLSDGYACMPSTISPLNKQD
jgi:predicted DNA-binding protein